MDADFPAVGRYRKRPLVIEARQWDGTAPGATAVIDWILSGGGTANYRCTEEPCPATDDKHLLVIQTLEGPFNVGPSWWVIRGVAGEFYACEDAIFRKSYEHVFGELSSCITT